MKNNRQIKNKKRFTIGFLLNSLIDEYNRKIWEGIVKSVEKFDINLICFPGGVLGGKFYFDSSKNAVFNLINSKKIDGLISLSGSLGNYIGKKKLAKFYRKFDPLPIVSIGMEMPDYPSILIDNTNGIKEVLEHFIRVHGFKRIAFLSGTLKNPEACQRYNTYKKILKANNISYNPDLVIESDFHSVAIGKNIAQLLDIRKTSFDAIMASNDLIAIAAIKELQERKIKVPDDIAVAGFDDFEIGSCIVPSLTTIKQPLVEIGEKAFVSIMSLCKGKEISKKIILPTKFIVRRSCGCFKSCVDFKKKNISGMKNKYITAPQNLEAWLVKKMQNSFNQYNNYTKIRIWATAIVYSVLNDLEEEVSNKFLQIFDNIINESIKENIDISQWYNIIYNFFREIKTTLKNEKNFFILESIQNEVNQLLANALDRLKRYAKLEYSRRALNLYFFSENLISVFELDSFKELIIKKFPELGINSCYLSLYTSDLRYAKLIAAYDDEKNIREIVKHYLVNVGYQNFLLVSDGKKGLQAVYDYFPDIIICDQNMPNMKGDQFYNELSDNPSFKRIPFIFLSAINDENLIVKQREKGVDAFLKKPIEKRELLLTVEQLIKKYFEYIKLLQLATKDELTGLENRRAIIERLHHELFVREYRDLALIFFDIDNFKKINDNYGHPAGDKILKKIGKLLKSTIRDCDIAGRYGGDEFLVVLPNTAMNEAIKVSEDLRKGIKRSRVKYNKNGLKVTSSFGVVSLKDNEEDIVKNLEISSLKELYRIINPRSTDWKKIKKVKLQIADLLIKMVDNSLYKAKSTFCNNCNFNSLKDDLFIAAKCPECKSSDLIRGRDRIIAFE